FDVNVRRLDLNTGAWGETEYLVHPDYPSGAGFARSDAKPVAVAYLENQQNVHVAVVYEGNYYGSTPLLCSSKGYQYYYGMDVWNTSAVPNTGSGHTRPAMAFAKDSQQHYFLSLTFDNGSNVFLSRSSNFTPSETAPTVSFYSPETVPTIGGLSQVKNASVDVDYTGRQIVAWSAYDATYGWEVALVRSKSESGVWSSLRELISDFIEYPVITASVSANGYGSGAKSSLHFCDSQVLHEYLSSDGVSWTMNSLTYYGTSQMHPNLMAKSNDWDPQLHASSIVTLTASPLYRVKFESRSAGGLAKQVARKEGTTLPFEVEDLRKVVLADSGGASALALEVGSVTTLADGKSVQLSFTPTAEESQSAFIRTDNFSPASSTTVACDVTLRAHNWPGEISPRIAIIESESGRTVATLLNQTVSARGDSTLRFHLSGQVPQAAGVGPLYLAASLEGINGKGFLGGYADVSVAHPAGTVRKVPVVALSQLPTAYSLHPNYPNPFNPTTTLRFDLPAPGDVSLIIYNTLGQEVAELARGFTPAGMHSITWNASALASGVYYVRLNVADENGKAVF
ncbi:MAG: T9SS type A sorting domain-containing protein, partial [Acidobacteriota bacterium]